MLEAATRHPDPNNPRSLPVDALPGPFDIAAQPRPLGQHIDEHPQCLQRADVVPSVAREVPDLPRPLKNRRAPWLVREILAAREQRPAGHKV
jgi:hypothetical protein